MCCSTGGHHGFRCWGHRDVCSCGCENSMYFRPRFMPKEQRINRLKHHLVDLKNEMKAVEKHIVQIKEEI